MSDSLSSYWDDVAEYEFLCEYYKERVRMMYIDDSSDRRIPNPNSRHAEGLRNRYEKEMKPNE